jgi:hypothetical protein
MLTFATFATEQRRAASKGATGAFILAITAHSCHSFGGQE